MTKLEHHLRVEISEDGMVATIFPIARYPRQRIKTRHVLQLLEQNAVCWGVLEDAVGDFLQRWKHGHIEHPWVIARGRPPAPARGRSLKRIAPPARSGRDPVELLPLYVKGGEALFREVDAKAGRPGMTVRGQASRPSEILPRDVAPGLGIQVQNGTWFAERTGFLKKEGERVSISSTLIHRHDLPAAEYHWAHDAEIHGTVEEGVKLRIGGDLRVSGTVAAGVVVQVAGDLTIEGDVAGSRTTRLEVVGGVTVENVGECEILAGDDIVLNGLAHHAHCRTRGSFQADGEAARVIGGEVESVSGAVIREVGDTNGTPTRVRVGRARWVEEQIRALDAELKGWIQYSARIVEHFEARYASLLADRSKIYKLDEAERLRFEEARAEATREQARIDARIAEIQTFKQRLVERRTVDARAVIRVERAYRGCEFGVRSQSYEVKGQPIEKMVLCISPTSHRVLPVPQTIFDSADPDSLFTGESEYIRLSR